MTERRRAGVTRGGGAPHLAAVCVRGWEGKQRARAQALQRDQWPAPDTPLAGPAGPLPSSSLAASPQWGWHSDTISAEIEANGAITQGSVNPAHMAQSSSLTYIPLQGSPHTQREARGPPWGRPAGHEAQRPGSGGWLKPAALDLLSVRRGSLTSPGLRSLQSTREVPLHLGSRIRARFKVMLTHCMTLAHPSLGAPLPSRAKWGSSQRLLCRSLAAGTP